MIAFKNAKSMNFSPNEVISGLCALIIRKTTKTTKNRDSFLMIISFSIRGLFLMAHSSDTIHRIDPANKIVPRPKENT